MILSNPGFDLNDDEFFEYMKAQTGLSKAIKEMEHLLEGYHHSNMHCRCAMYADGKILNEIDEVKECVTFYENMVKQDVSTPHNVLLLSLILANNSTIRVRELINNLLDREQAYLTAELRKARRPKIIGIGIGLLVLVCIAFVYFKLA